MSTLDPFRVEPASAGESVRRSELRLWAHAEPRRVLRALGSGLGCALLLTLGTACGGAGDQDPSTAGDGDGAQMAAGATAEDVVLEEIAESVGLSFVYDNGARGDLFFPEMMGGGAALLDYDQDGDLDVYLVQGGALDGSANADAPDAAAPSDRLFRNEWIPSGTLSFRDVTAEAGLETSGGGYGMGAAVGDLDSDGWPDLYVANLGSNRLLRNRGDGTFEDVTTAAGADDERWSVVALFFDYDRDGDQDLFVGNYVRWSREGHRVCPNEGGMDDYCGPLAFVPQGDRLLRNRGDGSFEEVTAIAGPGSVAASTLGAVTLDADGDGWLDLYLAIDQRPNQLWLNDGQGGFSEEGLMTGSALNRDAQAEASMGIDAADFDGDGDEDLFMAHLDRETNTLFRNDGTGLFQDATVGSGLGTDSWNYTGFGTAFFDVDLDGWLDLLVVNGAVKRFGEALRSGAEFPLRQPDLLFHNQGEGRFENWTSRGGPALAHLGTSRGAAFGDVDNDGDPDVVVVDNDGPVRLLRNLAGDQSQWLGVRLVLGNGEAGSSSESPAVDALGAWAVLERGDGTRLFRRVRSAASYCSANDPRLAFGLGESTENRALSVQWPDGRWERFMNLSSGSYSTLSQGQGEAVDGWSLEE
ncbi:MAG: CRTAC1 family protein [Acidobacteriota bacterium]